jgi:large subunit ribosomal protein L21
MRVEMFAVVKIGSHQYRVKESDKIFVQKIDAGPGTRLRFTDVLLLNDGTRTMIGNPTVPGAYIEAMVLEQVKGEKIIVFKKKRRKGYRVKRGHRQNYTQIEIKKIVVEN